jgi:hypothetical protein
LNAILLQEQIVEAITTKETSFNRNGHPFDELRVRFCRSSRQLIERKATERLAYPKVRVCARPRRPARKLIWQWFGGLPGGSIGPWLDRRWFFDSRVGHLRNALPRLEDDIPRRMSVGD